MPLTVTVAKVEWWANGGFGGAPAEWLIRCTLATYWRIEVLPVVAGL